MATAVLHNISIMWNLPLPEADNLDADLPAIPPEFQDGNRVRVVQVKVHRLLKINYHYH